MLGGSVHKPPQLLNDSLSRDFNPMTGLPFANTMGRSMNLNSRPPQRGNQPPALTETPSEFVFEYNFDEYGVLYYLGSMGRRRLWQNPHSIGQVQAFASSIGSGSSVEAFVGRSVANCRTEDEQYSFFGVDLGMDRKCIPTHYTLRNRNSSTHVARSWYFEASSDGQQWNILDVRLYNSDNLELK